MEESGNEWLWKVIGGICAVFGTVIGMSIYDETRARRPVIVETPRPDPAGARLPVQNPSSRDRRPWRATFQLLEPPYPQGGFGAFDPPHEITFFPHEYDEGNQRYVKDEGLDSYVIRAGEETTFAARIVDQRVTKPEWRYGELVLFCGDVTNPECVRFLPTYVPVVSQ